MPKYLRFNGDGNYAITPAVQHDRIEMDVLFDFQPNFSNYYVDDRTTGYNGQAALFTISHNSYDATLGVNAVEIDGVNIPVHANSAGANRVKFLPNLRRMTLVLRVPSALSKVLIFTHQTLGYSGVGNLYGFKLYNGNNLVLHYDTSRGNLQDQTPNGHHGLLTGGEWLGEPDIPKEPDPINTKIDLVDTITINDLTTKRMRRVKTFTDTINTIDSSTRSAKFYKAINDAVNTNDVQTKIAKLSKTFTDAVNINDTIVKDIGKFKTDNINLNDTTTKITKMNKQDDLTINDDADERKKALRNQQSIITVNDSISKRIKQNKQEIITVTDLISKKTVGLTKVDVIDVINVTDSISKNVLKVYHDTMTVLDSPSKRIKKLRVDTVTTGDNEQQEQGKAFKDVITIIDSISNTSSSGTIYNDQILIRDNITKQIVVILLDTVRVNDSQTSKITIAPKKYKVEIRDLVVVLDAILIRVEDANDFREFVRYVVSVHDGLVEYVSTIGSGIVKFESSITTIVDLKSEV